MNFRSFLPASLFAALSMIGVFSFAAEPVDFSRDIRPLLSDRCFKCHGFDPKTREADLGLHTFEAATRDLGGYRAIKPGDSSASEIIKRLTSHDPDEVMPPAKANKPRFSPGELAKIKQWIDEGAKYEVHWSFVPPKKAEVPQKMGSPIDAFINRELKKSGLRANKKASPYTLIRRLSLDLRGFPPGLEETDDFIRKYKSNPATAYSQVVEKFLADPGYGEKWTREWLDLARYADTNGYEKDRERSIWPYRDWVIDALNRDMPYDQFSIEQLAGDMLPNATLSQRIATGFHRNTMLNEEGGIDPLEYRFYAMVDRVATTGTVWLGLTTGCAQCHTHKYDPITHTDYYAMMAILGNADEPEIEVPDLDTQKKREAILKQITGIEREAGKNIDRAAFAKWKAEQKSKAVNWLTLMPTKLKSNLPHLEVIADDKSIFASGDFTKRDVFEIELDTSTIGTAPLTAIRLEALPDERLPSHGPGTSYYEGRKGDFFLSELTAETDQGEIRFKNASVDFGKIQIGNGTAEGKNVIDGKGSTGWSTATQEGKAHELVLNLEAPVTSPKTLKVKLLFERHFVAALGRFRISVTTDKGESVANTSGISNLQTASNTEVESAYLRSTPQFEEIQKKIAALEKLMPPIPTTLVMKERPAANPRISHRHHRGEYLKSKEIVTPAALTVFPPIPEGKPANRLSFAQWLVSERNPLAARVAVNRAWRSFFGRGILHTAGDFGLQSEQPTHPELLDWMAVDFVENGSSMKYLHRLIVSSEAYQRDSALTKELLAIDPDNKFLARGPRHRLTGEVLRDSTLRVSHLLSQKIGGPSVFPPQPASVTDISYGKFKWTPSKDGDRYRRSLYTFSKRTAPFAAYLAFDGPTGESCLPRRDRSNTPLQALTLLNDPMFEEAAAALADLTLSGHGPNPVAPEAIATEMFRRALTRPPTSAELADLVAYFKMQESRIKSGELAAENLLNKGTPSPSRAAWKMLARVILNLNESVTKG